MPLNNDSIVSSKIQFTSNDLLPLAAISGRTRINSSLLATVIFEKVPFAINNGGELYFYSNGVYQPKGDKAIAELLHRLLTLLNREGQWSMYGENEVIHLIRSFARPLPDKPSELFINFKNGMYSWQEMTLLPHSPDYLSYTQLPVEYNPRCSSHTWDDFLASILPNPAEDAKKLLYQILALFMIPYTDLQTCFILLGEGSNGKSTFLRGLTALLGRENVSNVSLHDLEGNRFASSALVGTLANICADLPTGRIKDISILKGLTGEDSLQMEYKHKASFSYKSYARPIFSCNQMPAIDDQSEATHRRLMCIQFPNVFTGLTNPDEDSITDRLTTPEALSGAVNAAIPYIEPMVQYNKIVIPNSLEDWVSYYIPVPRKMKQWIFDNIELGMFDEYVVFQDAFTRLAREIPEVGSKKAFAQALRVFFPTAERTDKRVKNRPNEIVRVYKNIRLKAGNPLGLVQ